MVEDIDDHYLFEYYYNGKTVLDRAKYLIDEVTDVKNLEIIIRPIGALLLDHQMPRKTGTEVVTELRDYIHMVN